MPQALYAKEILSASIGLPTSANAAGYRFTFKSADGTLTLGYIEDNANTFTYSNGSKDPIAIRVDLTLNADAAFSLVDFYNIKLTLGLGGGATDDIKFWFETYTDVPGVTYYLDVDGNTYKDAGLTVANLSAGLLGDTMTPTDTESNEAFDATLEDMLSIMEALSTDEYTPVNSYDDYLWLSDQLTAALGESPVLFADDFVELSDYLIADLSTDIWTEEP